MTASCPTQRDCETRQIYRLETDDRLWKKRLLIRRCARCPFSREIERKATQSRRAAVGIDDGVIRVLRIQIPACCSEHEPVRRAYHGLQLDTAGARLSHVGRGLDEGVVRP